MKVLSLFDGMACGMLAFQDAGINVNKYVAFEIDKYATQTSSHNFPMIEHRGDVTQADFTEFVGYDYLVGGSPCTYWSIAQKNNRETEASGIGWELFSQYVRALHEAKPRYFIYENNKSMAKAIRDSITQTFGFEPICINSALLSAQNRNRLYWVGRRNAIGAYEKVDVEQPKDMGILLRDVLDGITDKSKGRCLLSSTGRTTTREYYLKNQGNMAFEPVPFGECGGKSYALTASYWKGQPKNKILEKSQRTHVAEPVRIPEYMVQHKARCLTASYAHKGSGEGSLATEAFPTNPNKQVRDYVAEPLPVFASPCEWDANGRPTRAISGADGKVYSVFEVLDNQITIKGKRYQVNIPDGFYIIRKLTVSECKRLQTVPEWYEFPVSDTQAYKMLGNGWTVSVISHLIKATQF